LEGNIVIAKNPNWGKERKLEEPEHLGEEEAVAKPEEVPISPRLHSTSLPPTKDTPTVIPKSDSTPPIIKDVPSSAISQPKIREESSSEGYHQQPSRPAVEEENNRSTGSPIGIDTSPTKETASAKIKASEYSTTIEKKYRNPKILLPILGGIGGVIILVLILVSSSMLHQGGPPSPTTIEPAPSPNATSAPPITQTANGYSFITKWGSSGTADGQFSFPFGVAVDSSGNVYVADWGNDRIQKFNSNGTFITKWGSRGNADGQLSDPNGVAVDSSGNVYVADWGNDRIQKFNSNGTPLIKEWGSSGTADGQFSNPNGLAVDSSGNVYVADNGNDRIQKFNSNGTFITKWGSKGNADGQFSNPNGVAVDSSGNVYVADYGNDRIQKFNSNGTFITKWGSSGTADGQFSNPNGLALDSSGNVYVADYGNDRIQVFASANHNN
jgi:DNA-binding beta-propeller fold protein YncE